MKEFITPTKDPELNPVDFYNRYKLDHALNIFEAKNMNKLTKIDDFIYDNNGTYIFIKDGYFIANGPNEIDLTPEKKYSPFMILVKYKFNYNHYGAYTFVDRTFLNAHIPYIRVGINYFKIITTIDRFGIDRIELKRWSKDEIKEDHGAQILKNISKFDSFINDPDNINYKPSIRNLYNLYSDFSHKPKEGEWVWTQRLIHHVFGEQYDLGIKYIKGLYAHPKKMAPILVLASEKRATGKSTFLDWLSILFGQNMVIISPEDLTSQFNSSYAFSNIIGIEETVTDRKDIVEKIKGLSAGKFVTLNQKFIDNAKLPFFGKFIITTNSPKRFMKIDEEEIRFWVRELKDPKFKNTTIDEDLVKEIPAFLYHLNSLPDLDYGKSRMLFEKDEIETTLLNDAKAESKSWLEKDLKEHFESYFMKYNDSELLAHPTDIKEMFFSHNSKADVSYIRKVLKDEMKLSTEVKHYRPFNQADSRTGRVFIIKRKDFIIDENITYNEQEQEIPF